MNHKKLTYENFTTERVIFWCLLLEEYGPTIKYIKWPDNDAAEALIRILLINSDVKEIDITREYLAESHCVKKLDSNKFPLT